MTHSHMVANMHIGQHVSITFPLTLSEWYPNVFWALQKFLYTSHPLGRDRLRVQQWAVALKYEEILPVTSHSQNHKTSTAFTHSDHKMIYIDI